MRSIYFASVCGATLLAVTSFANAQGTGVSANPDQGVTPKQCWDVSRNIIREKNPTDAGASSSEPKTTVGSTMSGTTGSGASDPTAPLEMRRHVRPECQIADKHYRNSRDPATSPSAFNVRSSTGIVFGRRTISSATV
jgi:hypothetical protein